MKNVAKKLSFILSIVVLSYLLGIITYKNNYFPIQYAKYLKRLIFDDFGVSKIDFKRSIFDCPRVNQKKLNDLKDVSEIQFKRNFSIEKIFFGDSLVEQLIEGKIYGIIDYVPFGHGGQVLLCAVEDIEYIFNFKPKKILLYLGGNDADKFLSGDWYDVDEAFNYYKIIIDKILNKKILPIIHLINKAGKSRDQLYVETLNQKILEYSKTKSFKVIKPLDSLSFDLTKEEFSKINHDLTYDGEHLKPRGYFLWVKYIKQNLRDF